MRKPWQKRKGKDGGGRGAAKQLADFVEGVQNTKMIYKFVGEAITAGGLVLKDEYGWSEEELATWAKATMARMKVEALANDAE